MNVSRLKERRRSFVTVNLTKLTAVMTLLCFICSSVGSQGLYALAGQTPALSINDAVRTGEFLPAGIGRVTDAGDFGGDRVVVCIQDLHCHPEVQRNISRILGVLEKEYPLRHIYVEGGYGRIDTSWLASTIKNNALRKRIVEKLVDRGLLTGSEYYSILSGRFELLQGIDDESMHKENLARLGEILKRKPYFEGRVRALDRELQFMKSRYFGSRNKSFDRLVAKYRAGGMASPKYFKLLEKYVAAINEDPHAGGEIAPDLNDFPNIRAYLELQELDGHLNSGKISVQVREYLAFLKTTMAFSEYNALLEDAAGSDRFYRKLSSLAKSRGTLLKGQYPDLQNYLEYLDKAQNIDVIRMTEEERRLVADIRIGLSKSTSELEVSFLSDFFLCFRDYLYGSLTAKDHEYFTGRFEKFRSIWGKYAYRNGVNDLAGDFPLLNDFYQCNCKRTERFVDTIVSGAGEDGVKGSKHAGAEVVVAGGFHSQGLVELLKARKISYFVITPNVTQDAAFARTLYEKIVLEQVSILKNAIQTTIFSNLSTAEKIRFLLEAVDDRQLPSVLQETESHTGSRLAYDAKNNIVTLENGDRIDRNGQGVDPAILQAGKAAVREAIGAFVRDIENAGILSRAALGDIDGLLFKMTAAAVDSGWYQGRGIPASLSQELEALPVELVAGIQKEIAARFPEPIAAAIIRHQEKDIALANGAQRMQWLKVLLAVAWLRDILIDGYASEGVALSINGDPVSRDRYGFEKDGRKAEVYVYRIDPSRVSMDLSVDKAVIARDIVDDEPRLNPKGLGKSVRDFVADNKIKEKENVLLVLGGVITGNYWETNSAVVMDGELLGKTARGLFQDTFEKLNGEFWVLSLDADNRGLFKVEVKDSTIIRTMIGNEWVEGSRIRYGLMCQPIIINGKSNADNLAFDKTPPMKSNEVLWVKDKRMSQTALGYDRAGNLVRVAMAGNPDEDNEPVTGDVIEEMIRQGVENAILTGGSADLQIYDRRKDELVFARPRRGSFTEKTFAPKERPLSVHLVIKEKVPVLDIEDRRAGQVERAGGKAASIHELAGLDGIRVPKGFVVTTDAYDEFIRSTGVSALIEKLESVSQKWKDLNGRPEEQKTKEDEINLLSREIQTKMLNGELNEELRKAISDSYGRLGGASAPGLVAVRSSANAEDTPDASFAGQYTTYLNQQGNAQVLDAVRKVWASTYNFNAVNYRNRNNIPHRTIRMAALVLEMINPQSAGTAFSVDLETGLPMISINNTYGLGEAEVAGEVTSDSWIIDPAKNTIIKRRLGNKEIRIEYDKAARRNKSMPNSAEDRARFAISPAKAREIAQQVKLIHDHYTSRSKDIGFIDAEYAVAADGTVYFTQARPETVFSRNRTVLKTVDYEKIARDPLLATKHPVLLEGGITGSLGVASGRIRIVRNVNEANTKILPGDIMVCPNTTSVWERAMGLAGAILTEIGGAGNHTSVVAREQDKPAIVGNFNTIERLERYEGQTVTVDALHKKVYLGEISADYIITRKLEDLPTEYTIDATLSLGAAWEGAFKNGQGIIDENGKRWIGKPNEPTSRFLHEVHARSHEKIAAKTGLEAAGYRIAGGVLQFDFDAIHGWRLQLEQKTLDELEEIYRLWQDIIEEYLQATSDLTMTTEGVARWIEAFTMLNGIMNLAFPLNETVMNLREKALKEKGVREPYLSLSRYSMGAGETLSNEILKSYARLLDQLRRDSSRVPVPLLGLVKDLAEGVAGSETALMDNYPAFYRQLLEYAGNYRVTLEFAPSLAAPLPTAAVARELIKDFYQGRTISASPSPAVEEYYPEDSTFNRIMRLSALSQKLKQDSHHIKFRGQWKFVEKLRQYEDFLVKKGVIADFADIFIHEPEWLTKMVGRFEDNADFRDVAIVERYRMHPYSVSTPAAPYAGNPVAPLLIDKDLRDFIERYLSRRYTGWGLPSTLAKNILDVIVANAGDLSRARGAVFSKVIDFEKDEAWQNAYKEYQKTIKYKTGYEQIESYVKDLPRGSVILDVGAGNNKFGTVMAEKLPGVSVIGTDIIDYHEESLIPNLSYLRQSSPVRLPRQIKDKSVDVITMKAAMHHVSGDLRKELLKEMKRVLKPGGKLILIEETYSRKLKSDDSADRELTELLSRMVRKHGDRFVVDFLIFNDWYSNMITHELVGMDLPFEFMSIEEWQNMIASEGLQPYDAKYYGFAEKGFHLPGIGVIVYENQEIPPAQGTVEEIAAYYAAKDVEGDYITNLREGFKKAIALLSRRYPERLQELRTLKFRVVADKEYLQEGIDNEGVLLLSASALRDSELAAQEILRDMEFEVLHLQKASERTLETAFLDVEEIIHFMGLGNDEKSNYLAALLDLRYRRSAAFNLVASIESEAQFEEVMNILSNSDRIRQEDLDYLKESYGHRDAAASPFKIVLQTSNLNISDGQKKRLEKFSGIFSENLAYLKELWQGKYPTDDSTLFYQAIEKESQKTGVAPVIGIMGVINVTRKDDPVDALLLRRRYQVSFENTPVNYVYLGGGGFIASTISRSARWVSEQMNNTGTGAHLGINITTTWDRGGSSQKDADAVRRKLGIHVISPGDIMSVLSWQTATDASWFSREGRDTLFKSEHRPENTDAIMNLLYTYKHRMTVPVGHTLEELIMERISEVDKDSALNKPENWLSFIVSLRSVARIIDKELIEQGYLDGIRTQNTSIQNLVAMALIIAYERDVVRASREIHYLLGLKKTFALPLSFDDAVLGMKLLSEEGKPDREIVGHLNFVNERENYQGGKPYQMVLKENEDISSGRPIDNLALEEYPVSNPDAVHALLNVRRAIVMGMGSAFDSMLAHFMLKDADAAIETMIRKGIPSIYFPKITQELQTEGLSFREVMQLMERSIQGALGDPAFRIERIITHVFLPKIPQKTLDAYQVRVLEKKGLYLNDNGKALLAKAKDVREATYIISSEENWSEATKKKVNDGEIKVSKMIPGTGFVFGEEDREYLREKGIIVVEATPEEQESLYRFWEDRLNYNTNQVIRIVDRVIADASTYLNASQAKKAIDASVETIQAFLEKLGGYVDHPEASPYKDIAGYFNLWEAVRRSKEEGVSFDARQLTLAGKYDIPRIEIRDRDHNGDAAQITLSGIPGHHRYEVVRDLQEKLGGAFNVIQAGRMTIEISRKGVNKALPVEYVSRHFDEILQEIGYTGGSFIDARKTRTVVISDGDGTLYGKPTRTTNPALHESPANGPLIRYMKDGGLFMVDSSNDLQQVVKRLLENNAIPPELFNRLIVAANGGASLVRITPEGQIVEIKGYRSQALKEKSRSGDNAVQTLDAVYLGDDARPKGNDYVVFETVGFSRSVSVSDSSIDSVPSELRRNYIGGFESGTGAFLAEVVKYAAANKYQRLFDRKGLQQIIEKARTPLTSLTRDELAGIAKEFQGQMDNRGNAPGRKLIMEPSFITGSEGNEKGEYIAVDWGGSNLRIMRVRLAPGMPAEILKKIEMKFTKQDKNGVRDPFKVIAGKIMELGLDPQQQYDLGFTFSQAVDHKDLSTGILQFWVKGWNIPSAVGKEVSGLLQQALDNAGAKNVRVKALLNDVVATQLAVPNADVGMILGTGFTSSVTDDQGQIINTDAGEFNFQGLPQTIFDRDLYQNGEPAGKHAFEKMVSGAYLGRLLLMHLRDLRDNGVFMKDHEEVALIDEPDKLHKEEFEDQGELEDLLHTISRDLQQKFKQEIPDFASSDDAVEWLNEGQVFKLFTPDYEKYLNNVEYELYHMIIAAYGVNALPALNPEQVAALIRTPEGQKLQRIILNLIYADKMPEDGPDGVMSKLLSFVEQYDDMTELRKALSGQKQFAVLSTASTPDLQTLKAVSAALSKRAGRMVAAVILAGIEKRDPAIMRDHIVAVDGSVYERHPKMRAYINEAITELRHVKPGDKKGRITFVFAKDASSVGAAIAAARAGKASHAQFNNSIRRLLKEAADTAFYMIARLGLVPGSERNILERQGTDAFTSSIMQSEINEKSVDKALPVEYVSRHFDEILKETGYTAGISIDASRTRTIVIAGGDTVLYGKHNRMNAPQLQNSSKKNSLVEYMRAGGFVLVESTNDVQLVVKHLLEDGAIPPELRQRIIVAGHGGTALARITEAGEAVEFQGYLHDALSERNESTDSIADDLDAIYIGDDVSEQGADYRVSKKLGFHRSVTVSDKSFDGIPEELRPNYVGGLEKGTAAFLKNAVAYAAARPFQRLFDRQGLERLVERTRISLMPMDSEELLRIEKEFLAQLENRETGAGRSTLSMEPGYITASDGRESGDFVAVDWGGSNLRVMLVRLVPGRAPEKIRTVEWKFTEQEKSGYRDPFRLVAEKIAELGLDGDREYGLGFTFSHPVEQKGLSSGKLRVWMKGWNIPGAVGQDVGKLLQQALDAGGMKNVRVRALLNDVVATHLAVPHADVGLILGTGPNSSVTDGNGQIMNTESGFFGFQGLSHAFTDMNFYQNSDLVNMKMVTVALLGDLLLRHLRKLRDSGEFMGAERKIAILDEPYKLRKEEFGSSEEVQGLLDAVAADVRRKLHRNVSAPASLDDAMGWLNSGQVFLLFSRDEAAFLNGRERELYNRVTEAYSVGALSELSDGQAALLAGTADGQQLQRIILNLLYAGNMPEDGPAVVMSRLMSMAERYDSTADLRQALSAERQFAVLGSADDRDLQTLKELSSALSRRAGRVVAAVILASIEKQDPGLARDHVVAVDGSVYEKHPKLRVYVDEAITEMRQATPGDGQGRITFVFAKDASSTGAAIAAARAGKAAPAQFNSAVARLMQEEAGMLRHVLAWLGLEGNRGRNIPAEKGSVASVAHIAGADELPDSVRKYGASSAIAHVWFADLPDGMTGRLSPVGIKISIEGKPEQADVWMAVRGGVPVFYMDLKKAGIAPGESVQALRQGAAQIAGYLGGTDTLAGDEEAVREIRAAARAAGVANADAYRWKPSMVVDHRGDAELARKAFSDTGINSPVFVNAAALETAADKKIDPVIRKMLIRNDAQAQMMGENKLLKMDIRDIGEFVKVLRLFNSVGNGRMLVDWKIFEEGLARGIITEDGMEKLFKEANNGVQIYVLTSAKASLEKKLLSYGFAGVIAPEQTRTVDLKNFDPAAFAPEDILDIAIPEGMTGEEIRKAFGKLDLANTMIFHSRDVARLIDGAGDILDRKGFSSLLHVLLNFGKTEIVTPEKARRLGYSWTMAEVPHLLPGKAGQAQVRALLEGDYGSIPADSALFEQVRELQSRELRAAFLQAIAEKMLVREALLQTDREIAGDYEKGRLVFSSPGIEDMLGRTLLKRFLSPSSGTEPAVPVRTAAAETATALILRLNAEIQAGTARPGSLTALIDIILREVKADRNVRRHLQGKTGTLDVRTVNRLLSAA